jgi:protein-S-isoprenylcysteine O-methyltransferase Ste14
VVSKGLYRFIRHPIYVGDLLLLIGLELSLNSWLVLGVILLLPVVIRQAVSEEKMLMRSLPGYETYCARTKRFIPFLI